MNFNIDRSKWRCGGHGYNPLGEGDTMLLNQKGYMCCLGQISLQLGYENRNILLRTCPDDCTPTIDCDVDQILVTRDDSNGIFSYLNSKLSSHAMSINDDPVITQKEREEQLITLFKGYGHTLTFSGIGYTPKSNNIKE